MLIARIWYFQTSAPVASLYYPIPAPDARALYAKYADRAAVEQKVSFLGRLATYRYYNMELVVGSALAEFEKFSQSSLRN